MIIFFILWSFIKLFFQGIFKKNSIHDITKEIFSVRNTKEIIKYFHRGPLYMKFGQWLSQRPEI